MTNCKLGEHGCYEDGKCHYTKFCENQVIDSQRSNCTTRDSVIEEFAEKLKAGLSNCRLITDDSWCSGFSTGDIYELIARTAQEMKAGE